MEVMVLTFIVLGLIIVGMSVGVLMGRKPIAGSCGGMAALGMDTACDICKGDKEVCDDYQEQQANSADRSAKDDLAYEVKS
ncbi:(Na+)-NQR maturation NqrM [Marinobacterium jannaschii]|uniref:(Na+)-NQR maturation NqrM n=1 Tax=Marinobacterium jannaschii TaxID=64970 RepID=UPI000483DB09|nr:(Na+)-NQR maturation NqrM [Marinobacterium jannaschii]